LQIYAFENEKLQDELLNILKIIEMQSNVRKSRIRL